jgi:hypothetical protein
MSKANAEMIDLIKAIAADVAEMKVAIRELQEDNAQAAVGAEKMYQTLNVKFDMLKNLETTSREAVQQTATRASKPTRPAFFKQIFADERDAHIGTLYNQEDIDAAFAERDVVAKKKEADNKAASIVYQNCLKGDHNKARIATFEQLYATRNP